MSDPKNLTPKFEVAGTVLNHEVQSGVSKKNQQPYHMIHYMLVCGEKLVKLTVSSPDPTNPPAPYPTGKVVKVNVKPHYQANGVIPLEGELEIA